LNASNRSEAAAPPPTAVAIPCYNEAAAIGAVVEEWRRQLPDAEVLVFDNNSTDESALISQNLGARVVPVPEQGKGHVVRAIFRTLGDREAVVMIDGDGTYPAEAVGPLLEAVHSGQAEMAVGARRPIDDPKAMSPVRGLGNVLIGLAFRLLIGRGNTDLLSGYRVFSRTFMNRVQLRSTGFEIETELASEAAGRRLAVVEFPTPYRPRVAGTTSKLRIVRDGLRILKMMVRQSLRLRPWRPLALLAAPIALLAAVLRSPALVGLTLVLLAVAACWRLLSRNRARHE